MFHKKTTALEFLFIKLRAWESATLSKRDSNIVVFLWNLQNLFLKSICENFFLLKVPCEKYQTLTAETLESLKVFFKNKIDTNTNFL